MKPCRKTFGLTDRRRGETCNARVINFLRSSACIYAMNNHHYNRNWFRELYLSCSCFSEISDEWKLMQLQFSKCNSQKK